MHSGTRQSPLMYNYKLIIAYDGTRYSGWQIQPNAVTIQQLLQNILQTFLHKEHVSVIGSGRTDAGVHAKGQTAHFKNDSLVDTNKVLLALNGMLPRDIRVLSVEEAPTDFHAQYSASGKEYHYNLFLDRVMDPFRRNYCWHVHQKVDLDLLKEATLKFLGTHDFTSFANEAHAGSAARNPVRTLRRLDMIHIDGGVRLEFESNGFLYKMVRNIVGTSIEVATGKRSIDEISLIFAAKDRKKAGIAAPPQGLFLMRVDYGE